jgi:hypothetical protein
LCVWVYGCTWDFVAPPPFFFWLFVVFFFHILCTNPSEDEFQALTVAIPRKREPAQCCPWPDTLVYQSKRFHGTSAVGCAIHFAQHTAFRRWSRRCPVLLFFQLPLCPFVCRWGGQDCTDRASRSCGATQLDTTMPFFFVCLFCLFVCLVWFGLVCFCLFVWFGSVWFVLDFPSFRFTI